MADISSELATIHDDPLGRNVKQAIYDALMKVNYDVEHYEPKGAEWPIDHMIVGLLNGYLLPTEVGKMGENPNTEYVWLKTADFNNGITPVRDSWCIIEEHFSTNTEDPAYETGTISDSGSHTWTKLADYKLLGDAAGTTFCYKHLWITRLSVGDSITLSGDRDYVFRGFLIQNGAQEETISTFGADVLEDLPYPAPRVIDPEDHTTTVYVVSDAIPRFGNDNCPVQVMDGMGEAERYPEYGIGGYIFLFVRTDSEEEGPTVIFEESDGPSIPFFSGGTAITTIALR